MTFEFNTSSRSRQKGFSLLEMLFATVMLLVGLVAVAQLVPATMVLNYRNRMDSAALVFAQRQLDILLDQPVNNPTYTDPQGNTYQLGNPATPNVRQGYNVLTFNNQPAMDFGGAVPPAYPTNGYGFTYQDATDPNGTTYDVRWAVIVTGNASTASSKRFILGVQHVGGNGYFQPITLDTMVSK